MNAASASAFLQALPWEAYSPRKTAGPFRS